MSSTFRYLWRRDAESCPADTMPGGSSWTFDALPRYDSREWPSLLCAVFCNAMGRRAMVMERCPFSEDGLGARQVLLIALWLGRLNVRHRVMDVDKVFWEMRGLCIHWSYRSYDKTSFHCGVAYYSIVDIIWVKWIIRHLKLISDPPKMNN